MGGNPGMGLHRPGGMKKEFCGSLLLPKEVWMCSLYDAQHHLELIKTMSFSEGDQPDVATVFGPSLEGDT